MNIERKDYIILALGLALIAMLVWLVKATTAVSPVGGEKVIINEVVKRDTVIKLGGTIIKKVPMKETIVVDNTDTLKIKALLTVVDSLEKNLISMRVSKKLSLDTICGTDSDTVNIYVDVYKKQLDSISIKKKPIVITTMVERVYIPRSSTETWLLVGVGALGASLLYFIFGGK